MKKVLRRLTELADNEPEKYAGFWKEFGAALKEGIADDYSNRDEIARLLRFTSTKSTTDEPDISLGEYVGRMKEGQENIYYLLAPVPRGGQVQPAPGGVPRQGRGGAAARRGRGQLGGVSSLREFDGKRLQSVAQGAGDLGALADEEEKQAKERAAAEYADLLGKLKALPGRAGVGRAAVHPAHHVPGLHRGQRAETDVNLMQRLRGTGLPRQAVLELNPKHPLIQRLNRGHDDQRLASGPTCCSARRCSPSARGLTTRRIRRPAERPAHRPHRRRDGGAAERPEATRNGCWPSATCTSPSPPTGNSSRASGRLPATGYLSRGTWRKGRGHRVDAAGARARFAEVVWVPGNHELWAVSTDPVQSRGEPRYQYLVSMCRRIGVFTPEDPFPVWEGADGPLTIVPLFVLYDYSFRPDGTTTKAEASPWRTRRGIVCSDEAVLHPDPYPSREAWCHARVAATERRLAALRPGIRRCWSAISR